LWTRSPNVTTPRPKRTFLRVCRIYFRRFRMIVWCLILSFLGALIYINQIGLPGFVKQPLLDALRARGLDLQFSRLRVRWYQGIVAENVRLGPVGRDVSPQITCAEVQLQLNGDALTHFRLQVDGLALHQGRVIIPIRETNQPPRQFMIDRVETHLRLLPDDVWHLNDLKAWFMGATFQFSAAITNASAIRDWNIFQPTAPTEPGLGDLRLHRLADIFEASSFAGNPEFRVDVRGDARDLAGFQVLLLVAAPAVETPWGALNQGRFKVRIAPDTNHEPHAEVVVEAADAQTRWANVTNLNLKVDGATTTTNIVQASLNLTATMVESPWATGQGLEVNAHWIHALTNAIPLSGDGEVTAHDLLTRWGTADSVRVGASLATPPVLMIEPADSSWAAWAAIRPYVLSWQAFASGARSHDLSVDSLSCEGTWSAPSLVVTNLQADLYGGHVEARSELDVASRALDGHLNSTLDPHSLNSVLPEAARRFLEQFTWNRAPKLEAGVQLTLPAWTNREPDWQHEVQPTLHLAGKLTVDDGISFRGIPAQTAELEFNYTNLIWRIPSLHVQRPEGAISASHEANELTGEFLWRIQANVDPEAARPVLDPSVLEVLNLFRFSSPPQVQAELHGQWDDPSRFYAGGKISMTNFVFRDEPVSSVQGFLQYSNQLLLVTQGSLERGTQHLSADGLLVDLPNNRIFVTNGLSTAEPMVVGRAIGPQVSSVIEPYVFSLPPSVRVNGIISLADQNDADLTFDVEGGPFHCARLNAAHIHGRVHWQGSHLSIEDVRADAYGGRAWGQASFDFLPAGDADYRFGVTVTNIHLDQLTADLSHHTNNPEGQISGEAQITHANTSDLHTIDGHGRVALRDGLLWDIPIFGVFSEVLNGISPGLGNSRATAATARFTLNKGSVRSDDLEIRSAAFRLAYRGTIDLDGHVNARVEVAPLRDLWLLGPAVSTVFWPVTKLFEYKVSGTLEHPRTEPANVIPKLIQMPFHPLRTFRDLFPDNTTNSVFAPLPESP
jgi:hypothetical protein